MHYLNFEDGEIIEVQPTYRCQMNPVLNSNIRNLNNLGSDYKQPKPYKAKVLNETLNGIWVISTKHRYDRDPVTNTIRLVDTYEEREYLEKEKYIFTKVTIIDQKLQKHLDNYIE